MGRNSIKTDEVVRKLEQAFEDGLNALEACSISGISRDTYYRWLNEDQVFSDRMNRSQLSLTSKAKSVIARAISKGDTSAAKWYLDKEFRKSSDQPIAEEAVVMSQADIKAETEKAREKIKKLAVTHMNLYVASSGIDMPKAVRNKGLRITVKEARAYSKLDFDGKFKMAMDYMDELPQLNRAIKGAALEMSRL